MSLNQLHPAQNVEPLPVSHTLNYNWEYDESRAKLMRLYENAKRDQWNSTDRLDWSIDVDPESELVPDMAIGIYGTPMWNKLTDAEVKKLRHEAITWQLAQFLHGEQGALLATAQIVDVVPWHEAKQYGATQVMDEARHVEVYRRFIGEKLEHEYPVNPQLKQLLDLILSDSRWDMKFLGMQIMVEGLALAAFGVLSLREFCLDMNEKEREEREDFVYEASVLMRDRILNREVWETMGMDADACIKVLLRSPLACEFRRRLFSKIVPNVKSLGLLSDRQRRRFETLGVLEFENNTTSDVDSDVDADADADAEEERRMKSGEIEMPA